MGKRTDVLWNALCPEESLQSLQLNTGYEALSLIGCPTEGLITQCLFQGNEHSSRKFRNKDIRDSIFPHSQPRKEISNS